MLLFANLVARNISSLFSVLEPLAYEVLGILVDICGVPEVLAKFVGAMEDLETLLIRLYRAVEGKRPIVPKPRAHTSGPFLPSLRVGS